MRPVLSTFSCRAMTAASCSFVHAPAASGVVTDDGVEHAGIPWSLLKALSMPHSPSGIPPCRLMLDG